MNAGCRSTDSERPKKPSQMSATSTTISIVSLKLSNLWPGRQHSRSRECHRNRTSNSCGLGGCSSYGGGRDSLGPSGSGD